MVNRQFLILPFYWYKLFLELFFHFYSLSTKLSEIITSRSILYAHNLLFSTLFYSVNFYTSNLFCMIVAAKIGAIFNRCHAKRFFNLNRHRDILYDYLAVTLTIYSVAITLQVWLSADNELVAIPELVKCTVILLIFVAGLCLSLVMVSMWAILIFKVFLVWK